MSGQDDARAKVAELEAGMAVAEGHMRALWADLLRHGGREGLEGLIGPAGKTPMDFTRELDREVAHSCTMLVLSELATRGIREELAEFKARVQREEITAFMASPDAASDWRDSVAAIIPAGQKGAVIVSLLCPEQNVDERIGVIAMLDAKGPLTVVQSEGIVMSLLDSVRDFLTKVGCAGPEDQDAVILAALQATKMGETTARYDMQDDGTKGGGS